MRRHFQERRGHRGSGSARGRWRQRCSVGFPEEDDGRPANRAGPPISEEEAAGQAGPEGGGGREVGHGWVERGRERGGPRLGRKPEMAGQNPFKFYLEFGFFGKLWKFAQGDSEGILTRGSFLKSSRLLKDL
jgi:hypothetical protein